MTEQPDRERAYSDALIKLAQALILAISTSQATSNLPSGETGRRYWASVLFARLCGVAGSLQRILPGSASNKAGSVWDSTSALALCRTLLETDLALFYLCLDELTPEAYALRLNLMFLHDCMERPRIMERFGEPRDTEMDAFQTTEATRLRGVISANAIFQAFPAWKQKRLLEGKTPYYLSQDELFERQGVNSRSARGLWEFFSSHSHSYPFSFYRTPDVEGRGTGRPNRVDLGFSAIAGESAADMLNSASARMAALFPDVPKIPRYLIDWDTLLCRRVTSEAPFVIGMKKPG